MADHDAARLIKRGELAVRTGCHLETIRYYENIGLMPEPARTGAGHRVYDDGQERRLRFILRARDLGFSIDELKGLLTLVDSDQLACGEVYEMTQAHIENVRAKITDLRRLEKTLSTISSKCARGSTPECPIMDALYV